MSGRCWSFGARAFRSSPWVWSIELWAASVGASRLLLRSGRLDLAAFTALLPLIALLGGGISGVV